MPKKIRTASRTKGGAVGRKTIASGENEALEEKVEFVADLLAGRRSNQKIYKACAEKFGISSRQTDTYIAEVRRRWQLERDTTTIMQAKERIIRSLLRVAEKAEERIAYGENGDPRHNPDWWLVRQVELDIAKLEGIIERAQPNDRDIDAARKRWEQEHLGRESLSGDN